jgi:hypothetical protein
MAPAILGRVAASDPSRFLGVCASVLPKDVALSIEQRLPGNMDPADWAVAMECFKAIREAIPDASARQPGEVLEHTLAALRAYSAKPVIKGGG